MNLVLCFKLFDELTRSQILVLFEDCNSSDKYYQSKAVLLESKGGDDREKEMLLQDISTAGFMCVKC